MALKKCKVCGNELSSKADTCPNCRTPVKKIGCLGTIMIFLAIGFIAIVMSDCFDEKRKEKERIEKQVADFKMETERAALEIKKKHDFLKNIDLYYQKLIVAFKGSSLKTNSYIKLFEKYGKLDYKDVIEYKRKLKIRKLEAQVKIIPASKAAENLDIYKKLSALDPKNLKYKTKVDYYSNKLEKQRREKEKRQKIYSTTIAKYGEPPKNSGWDGSVSCVKYYLKEVAKDPDSLKFEKWGTVSYDPNKGWLVWCLYRGKNSFGGYVRNANWFIIRHDRVVDVKSIDAYEINARFY
jgi:hypothetical protein